MSIAQLHNPAPYLHRITVSILKFFTYISLFTIPMDPYEFSIDIELPLEDIPSNSQSNSEVSLDESESQMTIISNNDNANETQLDNGNESNSSNDEDDFDDLPFEVESEGDPNEELPSYGIDNKIFELKDVDVLNGWVRENTDSGSSCGPFLSEPTTLIDLSNPKPELFFNQLFDDRMWTIIADATNAYVHRKSTTPEGKHNFSILFYAHFHLFSFKHLHLHLQLFSLQFFSFACKPFL